QADDMPGGELPGDSADTRRSCRCRAGPATPRRDLIVVRGSAWDAASCTSRSGTPASRAVMNAWRTACGEILSARRATRRTIRPEPCRSSRWPAAVTKIWPSHRPAMARSVAQAVSGASGMDRFLAARADDARVRAAALGAQVLDV